MTPKEREERERREVNPPRLPDTTPTVYPGQTYDFTMQMIFDMKGSLGELTQSIKTLTDESKENSKKLSHISHVVYAVGAVVTVLGTIAGVILREAWGLILPILKSHFH
jgi:hypothetical protein